MSSTPGHKKVRYLLCNDIGCQGTGSGSLIEEFQKHQADWFEVRTTGCKGLCAQGPVVEVVPGEIMYFKVQPEDVPKIIEQTKAGSVYEPRLYRDKAARTYLQQSSEIPFYRGQTRLVLGVNGRIDPLSLEEYRTFSSGYLGLEKALQMKPEEVVEEITKSGLRGRGGGGFATGKKWKSVQTAGEKIRYFICNGDEGDPGAFMDRSVMQGCPFMVLEGMAIGAYAVGAERGFIYVRDEYPLAVEHLRRTISLAKENNLLGRNIMGSGFNFDVEIKRGAGAFVCGESSALMRSIEGKIGEPNEKYIHASERGLWGKPTVLNNVETLATVPYIIREGADRFRAMGNADSPGTKIFSLVGKIKNAGLIEVELGTTISTIIHEIGGGIPGERNFKAVQTGGPSGGCIPAEYADTPVDFDSLSELGSMMGSGGLIVMDDHDCMVEIARYYTSFLVEESCGKCTPCREGLLQMLSILNRITAGKGRKEDLTALEELGRYVAESSLCGLGKSAANPLLSTLRYFRHEYLDHIENRHCTAGVCKQLTTFQIDQEKCTACGLCAKVCPADAINVSTTPPKRYAIDLEKCISCGECRNACNFEAIIW
ncbi:MAG: NADH-ubiquinone oxidoreductase-F iron-sulfur binding region domain-containing protein [Spirochaetota bacterium]